MHISDFTMTRHAIQRILDMAVEPALVRECLTNPERVWESKHYPGSDMYRRGPIICAVERLTSNVVTVIWQSSKVYELDLARGGYDRAKSA